MKQKKLAVIMVIIAAVFSSAIIAAAEAGVGNKIILQKSVDLSGTEDSTLLFWNNPGATYFVQERMPGGQWNTVNPASGSCCEQLVHTGPYKVEYQVMTPTTKVVSNVVESNFSKPITINPYTITGIIFNETYTEYRFTSLPAGTRAGTTLFWVFDDGQSNTSGHTSMDARSAIQKDEKGYFARVYWPLKFSDPGNPNNLGNYKIFIAYY